MKNWKYIQVGNAKDKNGKELRVGDDVNVKTDEPGLNKGTISAIKGESVEVVIWHTGGSIWTTPAKLVSKIGNSKVGNGSGDWHGRIYEDSAGNSATVEKRGDGWEVYWEDSRGYGKPLGKYKDEKTARDVAEDAVETEMPDKIRGNYKSKAINKKVGNREIDLYSSNSGELHLMDDGKGWLYDPIELGSYEINGKADAMSMVRELEKLKRETENKVKDCQKFIDAIKQWANGLK